MTSDDLFRRWPVATILWLSLAWLSCEFFILGPYSFFRMHDSGNNNVALLFGLSAHPINDGYWFPGAVGGFDRLGSGFFTGIDRVLFAVLPQWLPSQIFNVAMIVVGGWFTFRLAVERLHLPVPCALVGALVHATMMGNMQMGVASVAFLPFLIWAIGRAVDMGTGWGRWLLASSAALAVGLSSQVHILLPFTPALVVLWFIVLEPPRRVADWLLVAVASGLTIAAQATVIIAMLTNVPHSYRGVVFLNPDSGFVQGLDTANLLLRYSQPLDIILFVFAALAFVLAAIRGRLQKPRLVGFLILIWLLPPLADGVKALVIPYLPFLSGFRFERFSFYDGMFLGLAGAVGLALISEKASVYRRVSWRALAVAIAFLLIFFQSLYFKSLHAYQWIEGGNYVQNFESPTLRGLAQAMAREPDAFRVASVNMATNVLAAYGFETIDGYVNVFSRRFREFWEQVVAKQILRDGPLMAVSEVRLLINANVPVLDFASYFNLDLLSLANVRYIVSRNEIQHPYLRTLHTPAGPWSALPLHERALVRLRENFTGSEWIYVYENTAVLPRAFLAVPERFSDPAALLAALSARTATQLRERALVLAADVPEPAAPVVATVQNLRREIDRIVVDVQAEGDSVLTVTENFNGFWRCRIDGQSCRLFPSYHTFMGIVVPRGTHRVTLTYEPPEKLL